MKKLTLIFLLLAGILAVACSSGGTQSLSTTPVIYSISPLTGDSNTIITINGANFGSAQGDSILYYCYYPSNGGTLTTMSLTPSSWSDSVITVRLYNTTLALATTGYFKVQTTAGESGISSAFTSASYNVDLTVSPKNGYKGTTLTLTTKVAIIATSAIIFDNNNPTGNYKVVYLDPAYTTATAHTFELPDCSSLVDDEGKVGIHLGSIYSSSANRVSFTYNMPSFSSLSQVEGSIGNELKIYGSSFGATSSTLNTRVQIGGISAVITNWEYNESWKNNVITVRVPSFMSSGAKPVVIMYGSNSSISCGNYTFVAPTIQSSPPSGTLSKDDSVSIRGLNFGTTSNLSAVYAYAYIKITSSEASYNTTLYSTDASVSLWSDNSITFKWPFDGSIFSSDKTCYISVGINGVESNAITVTAN